MHVSDSSLSVPADVPAANGMTRKIASLLTRAPCSSEEPSLSTRVRTDDAYDTIRVTRYKV
jgi:hypothetical protein